MLGCPMDKKKYEFIFKKKISLTAEGSWYYEGKTTR